MARLITEDVEYDGCPMKADDRVLMNFPAANRDPEKFEDPDKVILDRQFNPHIAFGVGIHRCAGSNLARMEMQVAIEEWLTRSRTSTSKTRRRHLGRRPGPRPAPASRSPSLTLTHPPTSFRATSPQHYRIDGVGPAGMLGG